MRPSTASTTKLLAALTLVSFAARAQGAAETPTVAMVAAADADDPTWPRWRGPSGQGHVAGSGYVDRWSWSSDGEAENVLWRVEVPGEGNSSPVLWGDTIFLTTAYDGGARRSVLAFSRSDGSRLWERFAPDADPEGAYPKNGHASSTPTADAERVYAYLGNHGLLALTHDGEVAWHRPMGPFEAFHGTASSPLLHDGRLILVQDHSGQSFIAAFDPATGRELWRTDRDARVGWNSPVAIRVGELEQIVMSGQQKVTAYDPQTGQELWQVEGNTFEAIPTPVVGDGLLFCSSGRAGPTLAIRPGASSAEIVWSSPKGSPFVPAPIHVGGYLYMVNDMASVLTVHQASTGEVVWQTRLGEARRESFSAAPVAADGKVFFTNDQGETFVVRQAPDFEILHVNRVGEPVIASMAGVDGVWYLRTKSRLLALGER